MMNCCWFQVSYSGCLYLLFWSFRFFHCAVSADKICGVIWTWGIWGIEKHWDFQEDESYSNKTSGMLCVWVVGCLEIQQMKPSSSNFAGRGIIDVSGAFSFLALLHNFSQFGLSSSASGMLFPKAYFSQAAWALTGRTWVIMVHKKTFSSLASSQTLIHYTYFGVQDSR